MAGQQKWGLHGDTTNAYIVRANLENEIYYTSIWKTIAGKINAGRKVTTTKLAHGDKVDAIDVGNSSVTWEKDLTGTTNECRFTMREAMKGSATYGDAPTAPGQKAQYKHDHVFVRQVDSPEQPILGFESSQQAIEVINNEAGAVKDDLALWRAQEVDLDMFRGAIFGASRGLLGTADGAMGAEWSLPGTTPAAAQFRSCYNFYTPFATNYTTAMTSLMTPSYTRATHESNVSAALVGCHDDDQACFRYEEHLKHSQFISELGFKEVTIGGDTYRAVTFCDPWNIERLTASGGTLVGLFAEAAGRAMDNPAIYRMRSLVLDDILYIPCQQLKWYRPNDEAATTVPTYGIGLNGDPRDTDVTAAVTSNICLNITCGAGAFLRGIRSGVQITDEAGKHGKGMEYVVHYHDGWKRREWFTNDGRSAIQNDSMLVSAFYDNGPGVAMSAH